MLRHVVAVAIAVCVSPVSLYAQTPVFTIEKPSADVYKGPSTGAPVIGHVSQGTKLTVTRDLGSWVRITWPSASDGIAYVHVSSGRLSTGAEEARPAQTTKPTTQPTTQRGTPTTTTARRGATPPRPEPRTDPAPQPVPMASSVRPVYVTPAIHQIGVGALAGMSSVGLGGSARGWRRSRLGGQFTVARSTTTSSVTAGEMSSLQFAPSVMYALPDRITDYLWLRPYLGTGVQFSHFTLVAAPGIESPSSNKVGFQAFGGGEFTFATVPQLALSADLTYRSIGTPFEGFEPSHLGFAVAAHWYFK
jgi:SH3 domain-containing protein